MAAAAGVDMLDVEGQLELEAAAAVLSAETALGGGGEAELPSASSNGGAAAEGFHRSGKGGTWKKFKKMVQPKKVTGSEQDLHAAPASEGAGPSSSSSAAAALPIDPTVGAASSGSYGGSYSHHSLGHVSQSFQQQQQPADDTLSEVAPSELGRGSRLSMRYPESSVWEVGTEDGGDSRKGTLKGMFKKQKKSKQIELDALRFEMGQLQERHDLTERDLASMRHDVGQLTAERDHLANQVHELSNALTLNRADLASTEAERVRLKELHAQVKAALQESYSAQQEQRKQSKALEELCAAQQNSLEEGEERFRSLQNEQDQLHHAALAAKAQLVTAQAQLSEARSQREELLAELAGLSNQVTALQAEIDGRDEKMGGLEAAAEQANKGLELALGRLRELERDQQQLEARVSDLQEENLELSTELSGVTELRRQLEVQVTEANSSSAALAAQVASLKAALERAGASEAALNVRLGEMAGQLASSSEASGSLRAQNSELQVELAALREQQHHHSKPSSPLSKWHKPKPAASSLPAAVAPGSAGSANGSLAATTGSATATSAAAPGTAVPEFSPMTAQLPAVRASSLVTAQSAQAGEAAGTQAPSSGDGTPSHADCVVIAAAAGESLGGADAAVTAAGGDTASLAASTAGLPALKPPVSSSSPDITMAKGPLTAARPASRRQPGPPGAGGAAPAGMQLHGRQSTDFGGGCVGGASTGGGGGSSAAHRKLSFGVGAVVAEGGARRSDGVRPADVFARMFGCLAPRVTEVV